MQAETAGEEAIAVGVVQRMPAGAPEARSERATSAAQLSMSPRV